MDFLVSIRCPWCRRLYQPGRTAERRRSFDHILPRAWGGTDVLHGDVRNRRPMCQECNGLRAASGHCVGMMACVNTIAALREVNPFSVANRLAADATMLPLQTTRHRVFVPGFRLIVPTRPALIRDPAPYTLKQLRRFRKRQRRGTRGFDLPQPKLGDLLPKEFAEINGLVAMRWNVRSVASAP